MMMTKIVMVIVIISSMRIIIVVNYRIYKFGLNRGQTVHVKFHT